MAVPASDDRFPVLEKYEIVEELGHGGMATVYRARDQRLGREVAVKVMHPHLRSSEEIAHRFFAEARAVAMLRHRNIVEVFDVSSEDERERYLVVELVRGKTLRKILAEVGAMPPEVAAAIAMDLLSALAHAHSEGVIHRDVKPENVLLELEKNGARGDDGQPARVIVKLTDFGIAKLLDAQGVTSTGQVLGSPAHMSPEQIDGQEVDGRADVFGLGVLFYECMVGHLPFEGTNPAQVLRRVLEGRYPSAEHEIPEIGKRWSQLVDHALAGAREERFPDARSVRDAIARELSRVGVTEPSAELAKFFAAPDAYRAAHSARMLAKLTELGHEARRRGDILEAASEFNRALAYAPSDPKLLRLVAGLQKAERRRKMILAVVPKALVFAVVLAGSYAGLKIAMTTPTPLLRASLAPRISKSIASETPSPTGSQLAGTGKIPVIAAPPRPNGSTGASKATSRSILMTSVLPRNGVLLSVDEGPIGEVYSGFKLTLDTKPHVLRFKCRGDVCEEKERPISAGNEDLDLGVVQLATKPVRFLIIGNTGKTYDDGAKPLPVGIEVVMQATSGDTPVTIFERPGDEKRTVSLRAGAPLRQVSFRKDPANP